MTTNDVEAFLTKLLPTMMQTDQNGQDYYQRAAMVILGTPDKFICDDDDDFTRLMKGIAGMLERQDRSNLARDAEHPNPLVSLHDYETDKGEVRLAECSTNPWTTTQAQALEYIELLPMAYRRIFYMAFIEGHETEVIADVIGLTPRRVNQLIIEGVQWIKDELAVM